MVPELGEIRMDARKDRAYMASEHRTGLEPVVGALLPVVAGRSPPWIRRGDLLKTRGRSSSLEPQRVDAAP